MSNILGTVKQIFYLSAEKQYSSFETEVMLKLAVICDLHVATSSLFSNSTFLVLQKPPSHFLWLHVLNIFGFHLVHPPPMARLTSILHPGNIGRKIINCHNCTHKYTPNRLLPAVGRARYAVMTNFLWLPRSACVASTVLIIHTNTLTHTLTSQLLQSEAVNVTI